ncbi:hypothetical protein QBC37DRAFT_473633 [Rhypophila decipiens]|uniref:Calcineurin-like phosphoesterase domain-containing protein n=1 Tax=Rhypophila decipiens TaxID=261697 RepID=A0AAN7B995_9PEZI|nr:hypothetical protein QBC37DRAFT_473633 [Rhypophila decipiens]
MMKIQILSDLHLESPKSYTGDGAFDITPKAPYFALLGDIGYAVQHKNEYLAFLEAQLYRFKVVLLVPGNHECYKSTWPETIAVLREFEEDVRVRREKQAQAQLGEFILLNRNTYIPASHPEIAILGCPLFSNIPPSSSDEVTYRLSDFNPEIGTSNWTVSAHNSAHKQDLFWLNYTVSALEHANNRIKKIVILTHWAPTRDKRAVDPAHYRDEKGREKENILESAFSTDLSGQACFKTGKVKVWAFGHTHWNCDFVVEKGLKTTAVTRGSFSRLAAGFDVGKVVEL